MRKEQFIMKLAFILTLEEMARISVKETISVAVHTTSVRKVATAPHVRSLAANSSAVEAREANRNRLTTRKWLSQQ